MFNGAVTEAPGNEADGWREANPLERGVEREALYLEKRKQEDTRAARWDRHKQENRNREYRTPENDSTDTRRSRRMVQAGVKLLCILPAKCFCKRQFFLVRLPNILDENTGILHPRAGQEHSGCAREKVLEEKPLPHSDQSALLGPSTVTRSSGAIPRHPPAPGLPHPIPSSLLSGTNTGLQIQTNNSLGM